MYTFCLPDLGEGLTDAEIHAWHVQPGQWVEAHALLVSVETDKALVDLPAPCSGYVLGLHAQPGERVPTGAVLVRLGKTLSVEDSTRQDVVGQLPVEQEGVPAPGYGADPDAQAHVASSEARAMAQQWGVDWAQLQGTGPQGAVVMRDVQAHVAPPQDPHIAVGHAAVRPLTGPRRRMAEAMQQAHREVVSATLQDEVMLPCRPQDITVCVIQALCAALIHEPECNAWYETGSTGQGPALRVWDAVHVGLAVDTPDGLLVPVLRDANQILSASQLRASLEALKQGACQRTLEPEAFQGATCLVSNFGVWAGRWATPRVLPPAVMIVGVGRAYAAPGDQVGSIRLPLSLGFDHRALTGGQVARLLKQLMVQLADQPAG